MRIIERVIHTLGRFAVGLGMGLALTSAYVIVTTAGDVEPIEAVDPAKIIRLDPVTVTISADRFEAIRAGEGGPTVAVHHYGRGPQEV